MKGALIEATDSNSNTPLHTAAMHGHTDVVELLLGKGASIEAINKDNSTPMEVATNNGHSDIVKLLTQKSANKKVPIDEKSA